MEMNMKISCCSSMCVSQIEVMFCTQKIFRGLQL
jgi:hypothetical protein